MKRSHLIRLYPNNAQETCLRKACGCRRLAFNWGLAEWKMQYENGESPSAYELKKKFNSIKKQQYPFVYEVTKTACEGAFVDLEKAFRKFFRGLKTGKFVGYPKFKRKGFQDSFYISNDKFQVEGNYIKIPKLNAIKMAENLRFKGKILSAVVSKGASMWFVSIAVEIPEKVYKNQTAFVGIDLGIKKLAVLSDGQVFENPRITLQMEKQLRRLNKYLSRKKKGSKNWQKAKDRLAKFHYRIRCLRQDTIHKMTSQISEDYTDICIEDLNVAGMVKNRKLSKAISDASFAEIKRQLEYKSEKVHMVDRFYPSSKTCSNCGHIQDMPLNVRIFNCEKCGFEIDRDENAAINIKNKITNTPGLGGFKACGDGSSGLKSSDFDRNYCLRSRKFI